MSRIKKLEIDWSYPIAIDSALTKERCVDGWGLYYISRKFGDNETLLYIGKTFHQNFIHRLVSHHKSWVNDYRGQKLIRFGEFVRPVHLTEDIVDGAESCLIYELKPLHNKRKKDSYYCLDDYMIRNTGFRGDIPKEISNVNH